MGKRFRTLALTAILAATTQSASWFGIWNRVGYESACSELKQGITVAELKKENAEYLSSKNLSPMEKIVTTLAFEPGTQIAYLHADSYCAPEGNHK